jgi:hypothetical protein
MKYRLISYFLAGIFTLITGCASTSITSFTDPDYKSIQFKNILVAANTNKLGYRLSMENRIVEVFANNGIKSIPSYSIFPPTREFTDSLKKDLMISNKIDGCLMVYFGESGIEQVQIPIIGSKTKGTVTYNSSGADYESKTTYIGGQVLDKPYAEFDLKLFDVINGKMAWIANSFTGGSAYSNFNTVYSSFCDKIVDRLSADNLIRTSDDIVKIYKAEIERIIEERKSKIDKIIKGREEKPEQDKIDVVVLKNGNVITGLILNRYFADANFGNNRGEIIVKIQDQDQVLHRIMLKDISEVYQK